MKAHQNLKLVITGYADSKGSEPNNIIVGQRRADSVKDYLIKNGVPNADRISTVSMGSKQPVSSNKTAAGRAMNRRISLRLAE